MLDERDTSKNKLSKRMDYHPSLFIQNDRISKFIRDMNPFKVKDLLKLRSMLRDFRADLEFYIRTLESNKKGNKDKLDILEDDINKCNIFDNPKLVFNGIYLDKLIDFKAEILMAAGLAEIIPTYVAGMPKHVR